MHAQTVSILTILFFPTSILLIADTWLELAEVSASGVKVAPSLIQAHLAVTKFSS